MYIVFEPICFSDTSLNIYIYILRKIHGRVIMRFRSPIGDENPQFFCCQGFVRSLWFAYR